MATWTVTINGTGAAFNAGRPSDIDQLAGRFVKTLLNAGHQGVTARCRAGAEEGPVYVATSGFDAGLVGTSLGASETAKSSPAAGDAREDAPSPAAGDAP